MGARRLLKSAIAIVCCAPFIVTDAASFTSLMAERKDRTEVLPSGRPGGPDPTGYGAILNEQIKVETKRTHIPFGIAKPFVFIVWFQVNRRGNITKIHLLQGSNLTEANEYAIGIVMRASRKFPPPPANLPAENASFVLPMSMNVRNEAGEIVSPTFEVLKSPSRSPMRRRSTNNSSD